MTLVSGHTNWHILLDSMSLLLSNQEVNAIVHEAFCG